MGVGRIIGANGSRRREMMLSGPGPTDLSIDLSMRNITGGTLSKRETANCYVISEPGEYKIPLVYGCAIMNGEVNAASYTRASTNISNTQPFYNHLNTQITSPYLENVATPTTAQVIQCDSVNYTISDLQIKDDNPCKFLYFKVDQIPQLGGNALIAVKDSSGNIMWSWHIWAYPFTLGTFTHTNTNNISYAILDVNLGWVKQAADSKWGSSPYYQWGRKDPMLRDGGTAVVGSFSITTCASSLAATIQNPTTFNTCEKTNYNWWNNNGTPVIFYNYWDADSTSTLNVDKVVNKTVYDPSPVGFSVPCGNAFLGFSKSNGGVWDSGWTWDGNYFAATGNRIYTSGNLSVTFGSGVYYWYTSSSSQRFAYSLYFDRSAVRPQYSLYRAYGFSVRPVARTPITTGGSLQ